jgi:hypothetical protein
LGDDLAFVQKAGDVIPERALADDDAGGVLSGVPRQPLELLRNLDEITHDRLFLHAPSELGLGFQGFGDGVHLPLHLGVRRDQAGERLRFVGGHPHGAPHVFDDAARLELVKRRNLADRFTPILSGDVVDDFVAAVHAEVDVEIRHRDALGIEESLE